MTKRAVLIDAPLDVTPSIVHAVEKHGLTLEKLLLTHSHWDHLADAAKVKKTFNIPVFVHPEDAPNLEQPGADRLPLPFPIEGVKPDGALEEGQPISVGELEIEVIHTPGHTPGCVCFWLKKENLLVTGDTLFKGAMGNLSFPTARPHLMTKSLHRLSKLPPDTRVYPGHGETTTIGAEAWISHV